MTCCSVPDGAAVVYVVEMLGQLESDDSAVSKHESMAECQGFPRNGPVG